MIVVAPASRAAVDHAVADAAAAKDRHAGARLHIGGVERRADPRHHAAADQRHLRRRQRGVVGDGLVGMHQRVRAEGADAQHLREQQPVLGVHALLGVEAGGAEVGLAGLAEAAGAAGRAPGQDDMVAGLMARHARPDLLDHTGALVAQQEREAIGAIGAALHAQVGVAHARRQDAHQNLVWPLDRRS